MELIPEMVVTPELAEQLLRTFHQEHGRTSCSDTNVGNGFFSSSGNWPRCSRCLLLEAAAGKRGARARIDITLTYGHDDDE